MQTYGLFLKRYGVRRFAMLATPPVAELAELALPRNTLLHYLGDGEQLGIETNNLLLRDIKKIIYTRHVVELDMDLGGPLRVPGVSAVGLQQEYTRTHRQIRPLRKGPETVTDDKTLVIENFAIIDKLYRYRERLLWQYHRWYNKELTLWRRAASIAQTSDRHQFVVLHLPTRIPSVTELRRAETSRKPMTLEPFNSPSSFSVLDLWTWLGEARSESLLGSQVDLSHLDRINIILHYNGKWTAINLGILNGWRKGEESEDGDEGVSTGPSIPPLQIQKRFLRLLLALTEAGSVSATGAGDNEEEDGEEENPDPKTPVGLRKEEGEDVDPFGVDGEDELGEDDWAEDDTSLAESEDAVDEILQQHDTLNEEMGDVDEEEETVGEIGGDLIATEELVEPYIAGGYSLEDPVIERAREMVDQGQLSAAQFKRFQELSGKYKKLPNPFGGEGHLSDLTEITEDELAIKEPAKIPDIETVPDKSMLESTLIDFDQRYVDNIMNKDIASAVLGVQRAGVAVTDFKVDNVRTATNDYNTYSVQITPVVGKPTTVKFRIPVVHEDGTVISDGVKYFLKKQRGDMPIRKVSPHRVALTSYYGKLFVDRSQRATFNYPKWLADQITAIGLDMEDSRVQGMRVSKAFDNHVKTPRIYSLLGQRFSGFSIGGIDLRFDYANRIEAFGEEAVKAAETNGTVVVGRKGKDLVIVDWDDVLFLVKGKERQRLGTIEELLDLPMEKRPTEVAVLRVFGKEIPMGVVLAHHLGLSVLLRTLNIKPRRVAKGRQLNLGPNEFRVRFKDQSLIFDRTDKMAELMFGGFNQYHRAISAYPAAEFDKKEVYANVLEDNGLTVRYIRELNLVFAMFIDHITLELLREINEPTDMVNLFRRAVELLFTDDHPDETDMSVMRIKGYERFSGIVYQELVKATRIYNARPVTARASIDLNPEAVFQNIIQDPSLENADDINPIKNLKQKEVVTYGGKGGRGRNSMRSPKTRLYHESDMGVISEATVDSGNVGVISYLSANPKFNTLRGTTGKFEKDQDGKTRLLSTSALLSPGAENDDPKRVNFISIQQSHVVPAIGYSAMPLRTGYEQVLAHRTDSMFAYTAKAKGKVTEKSKEHLVIEYEDGRVVRMEIGRIFGKSAGSIIPQSVLTDLKEGDSVEPGDLVVYNENYFEKDFFDPKQAVWKSGTLVRTAIAESMGTFEDSSVISEKIAKSMTTRTTYVRNIVVDFDQSVRNLVGNGDKVEIESILCTIEDAITGDNELFDEETLKTLELLSNATPRAKHTGVVEKVEVYYNGEVDEMSESLQDIAHRYDRERSRQSKRLGGPRLTGQVGSGLRIDNEPLRAHTLAIRIYITADVSAGVGDKGVFANQMKTIFGRVMSGVNQSEDGQDVDAIFSYQSISNRIVLSPEIIGTTNTLLKVISKRAAQIYKGKVDS